MLYFHCFLKKNYRTVGLPTDISVSMRQKEVWIIGCLHSEANMKQMY